jgi:hypothetical protein
MPQQVIDASKAGFVSVIDTIKACTIFVTLVRDIINVINTSKAIKTKSVILTTLW